VGVSNLCFLGGGVFKAHPRVSRKFEFLRKGHELQGGSKRGQEERG